ncbi:cache domain-containing sensor histidine kinase [Cohnella zeiphila]|uniref:Sensor histidine kinase n=1 Tax=Cohnella zeiphila TaxID=2761120 RepID=A0A7X0SKB4_9BACL|nr:sensor histidine kinase [Cohnella zeiphila]MBB6731567.1 sensor histidine kinase [Cohnella zeiphila]
MSVKKALQRWLPPHWSLQGKIFIAFGLVTLLAIVSVSGIVYMNMRDTIKRNAVQSVSDSIRQADESLNVMLDEIDRLNTLAATSDTVIRSIQSPNEEISYEWFQEQKRVTEYLSGLILYKPYIRRIAVVGLNGKVFFTGEPWLDRTVLNTPMMEYMLSNGSQHAYYRESSGGDAIVVGRELRYNRKTIGVVMVDLNADFLKKTFGVKPTADSLLYVLDEQNGEVYRSDLPDSEVSTVETSPSDAPSPGTGPSMDTIVSLKTELSGRGEAVERRIGGKSYIVVSRLSANTGWTTLALIPMDSLLSESTRIRNLMLEVSIVVFAVVLIGSLQVSSRTTLNIRRLKSMMMQVKDGNLAFPRNEIRSKDEIGELYRVFVSMVDDLNRLMEGVRVSEKEKREAELTALQAQIRPHFLYNSLNTIKYLAKLNGVPNIEEVSGSLIELLRSVLGNSSEFLTVKEELDYVNSYVSIAKYKFIEPIRIDTLIEDEALLHCRVPKLTLQPLVENAIVHGIGPTGRGGSVQIRVYEEDRDLKIEVTDNGQGMPQEKADGLLGETGRHSLRSRFGGMGVRSAHERIVRIYGESYGLKLYSEPGLYTKAELRFPKLPPAGTQAI